MTREKEHGQFAIIPARAIDDIRITEFDFKLLSVLGTYANRDGWCFPSLSTLASRLLVSPSKVSKRIKWLARCGYVMTVAWKNEDGAQTANRYRILYDAELPKEFDRLNIQAETVNPPLTEHAQTVNPPLTEHAQTVNPPLTEHTEDLQRMSHINAPFNGGGVAGAPLPPVSDVTLKAKERIVRAGIAWEKSGGKKRGVSDPRASAGEETLRWARLIATAAARHPITDNETFDSLPAKFRNDCIFNARDVIADLQGGQVSQDAYEKAFAYLSNGGGEQYGNGTTPARVTRDAVAFVMNGGKSVQSPGATQRYGKQPFIDYDALERERRDSDKRLEEFRRIKQQLENSSSRSVSG